MELSNLTKEYIEKLFSQGKRFDGRGLLDYRNIEVDYNISNKAEGSARVKIGKTEVVVGIKLGVGEPYSDSPDKGVLTCSAELLPLASPRFEPGPPGFTAIELGRLVDRAIRESGMIDLKKLEITPGEKVWTVFIDIYPINDDGNLIDASTLATILALKKTKMPALDEEGNIDYSVRKDHLPLTEGIAPLSFSFFKLGNSIILDPTREEEEACEARVTFGISKMGDKLIINSGQKTGIEVFTEEEILRIAELLPEKFHELTKKIKNFS